MTPREPNGKTPGPWRDEVVTQSQSEKMRGPLPQDFLIVGADGTVVGVLYDYAERCPANARLIAAAPELLEALKSAVKTIRTWHGMNDPDDMAAETWALYQHSPEMKRINSAISKAEGSMIGKREESGP